MRQSELGPPARAVYDRCRAIGLSEAASLGAAAAEQQAVSGVASEVDEVDVDRVIAEAFGRPRSTKAKTRSAKPATNGTPAAHGRTGVATLTEADLDKVISRAFRRQP